MSVSDARHKAEQAVLACLLLDLEQGGEYAAAALEQLEPHHFQGPREHCDVFKAVVRLHEAGEPVSEPTLAVDLARNGPALPNGLLGELYEMHASGAILPAALRDLLTLDLEDKERLLYQSLGGEDLEQARRDEYRDRLREVWSESEELREGKGGRARALSEILLEPESELEWLVEERVRARSLNLFAAKPKHGKSTLLRSLAVQIARHEPKWLGWRIEGGTVLYLAMEDVEGTRRHFRELRAQNLERLWLLTDRDLRRPGNAESNLRELRAEIRRLQPDVVMIDTLGKLLPGVDWNDYGKTLEALAPIETLCDTRTLFASHHSRKSGAEWEGDAVLGSTGIVGAVDTLFSIRREGSQIVISTVQRHGQNLEPTTCDLVDGWPTLGSSVGEAKREERRAEVLQVVAEQQPLSRNAVAKAIGGRRDAVLGAIRELLFEKRLRETPEGLRVA